MQSFHQYTQLKSAESLHRMSSPHKAAELSSPCTLVLVTSATARRRRFVACCPAREHEFQKSLLYSRLCRQRQTQRTQASAGCRACRGLSRNVGLGFRASRSGYMQSRLEGETAYRRSRCHCSMHCCNVVRTSCSVRLTLQGRESNMAVCRSFSGASCNRTSERRQ